MKKNKFYIVVILLLSAMLLSFALPRTQHASTNLISQLEIPYMISGWLGKDVREVLGLNLEDDKYNFFSEAFAHEYSNRDGENLIFIILDAGNFHHPNVCFTSAGFEIKELDDTEFHTLDRTFKAHTLYTERETESYLSFYWISINKKIVHAWTEQKAKQLYFSLFNKKNVGLMVRIDIPAGENDIDDAMLLAKKFLNDLSDVLQPEHADYIFGK